MPGLSDLKIKIKNQPHGLAWINDKERSVLKAMGGSGKSGPMGIPAYYDDGQVDEVGYDPDIGPPPDDPNEGEERVGPVQKGYSTISYDPDKGWDFNYEGRPHDLYEPGPFEKGLNKTIEDIFSKGLLGQLKGFADKTFGVGGPLTKEDVYQIGLSGVDSK